MRNKILVLEDNEDIRDIIAILLEEENFEVHACASVEAFRAEAAKLTPDLYLLDVMLPDGNGLDICCELKADKITEHKPVVMMSANFSEREVMKRCKAEDYIHKPFDIDDFVRRVSLHAH
ncbi:response regulator transcription factor [Pedobacter sp. AW1-32]|uniref:response regulator transcription factor n=1 Tax=Pedobacter sp. AW1-32 TaxID=3383026 RepID=UPI003FF0B3A7